jgi:hypothetical protein
MTEDDKLKPDEVLTRALVRVPADLDPDIGRPHQDTDDFVRKLNYRKTGKPENGISVFRRCKYPTHSEFYDRVNISLPMGASDCSLEKLIAKDIKPILDGAKNDHVSLRCPDCDMAKLPEICKPSGHADHRECPLFSRLDLLELAALFKEVDPPADRNLRKK